MRAICPLPQPARGATVVSVGLLLIAASGCGAGRSSTAPNGGDPGGRLMAKLVPVVRVVPGLRTGPVPWVSSPCDNCKFPVTYAMKIGPLWDSCDGTKGTFG